MSLHLSWRIDWTEVTPPDLSEYTSPEARAEFAEMVAWYISNEVGIRCKNIEWIIALFSTTWFELDDRYYDAVHCKFGDLFRNEIDATQIENWWDYIDITVKWDSWESCDITGGKQGEQWDIKNIYESKKTLVLRYE